MTVWPTQFGHHSRAVWLQPDEHHHALSDAEACAAIAIKLFNCNDNP